jgi:hypothetical protein
VPWQCSICKAKVYNSVPKCPICWNRDGITSAKVSNEDTECLDELDIDTLAVHIYSLKIIEHKMGMTPNEDKKKKKRRRGHR